MLSRSGSSTNSSLQRTKSTTSVKERRKHPLQAEPINPQTARTHALIAAHRAVDRSRAGGLPNIAQSDRGLSRRSITSHRDQTISFSPAAHLQRQRSTLQNRVPKLASALQVPGTTNRDGRDYDHVVLTPDFGMAGENYGAEPSSYRKLKRARSLLTPTRHGLHSSSENSETAFSQAPTLRAVASSAALQSPGFKLRLKRSLNFLRSSHTTPERVVTAPLQVQGKLSYRPESVALARSQFLQGLEEQRMSKKPSLSFSSKAKRAIKPFRSTVRNATQQLDGTAKDGNTDTLQAGTGDKLGSSSLGGRIKKIFRKSKQDENLPPQHLEASRAHFGDTLAADCHDASFDTYLDAETASSKHSSLYVPSNPQGTNNSKIRYRLRSLSQSGSSESLTSNSKSRVTSWTNSTATGSIAARPPVEEVKRLSIIKEDGGPHQPSSSAGRHIGGISIFQQPLNLPAGQMVDSQRVYSALLKRIDEEQKEMKQTQAALKEIHNAQEQDEIIGHYLFSSPTIRRVESEGINSLADVEEDVSKSGSRPAHTVDKKLNAVTGLDDEREYIDRDKSKQLQNPAYSTLYNSVGKYKAHGISQPRGLLGSNEPHRSVGSSHELEVESGSVRKKTNSNTKFVTLNKFGYSTESVYSRTTNGGTNLGYMSPVASPNYIQPQALISNDMAMALHSQCSKTGTSGQNLVHKEPNTPGSATERASWKGWMEHQLEDLEQRRPGLKPTSHFREHAQIDSDDTQVGSISHPSRSREAELKITKTRSPNAQKLQGPSLDDLRHSKKTPGLKKSMALNAQLKDVSRSFASIAEESTIMRRSQSALLNYTNTPKAVSPQSKEGRDSRDTSPRNVLELIKIRTSQPVLSQRNKIGKENNPLQTGDSPPVSTPGRCSIQSRNSNSLVHLRKGKSAFSLRDNHENATSAVRTEPPDDSPSGRNRKTLAARLSRPFDMDIPNHNRPFDSIFLGQRQLEDADRLSVAVSNNSKQRSKTYGDLGSPSLPFHKRVASNRTVSPGITALPMLSYPNESQRTASASSIGQASRRLVSTFIRNKRKPEASEVELSPVDSPAFV